MNDLRSEEAASAVAGLGKTLFGALFDAGLSAASSVVGDEELTQAQQKLRADRRAQDRRDRLSLFEAELAVLGIDAGALAELNERKLRRIYRQRSRELHPDLNAELASQDGEAEPTIYQINQAYETIKKQL